MKGRAGAATLGAPMRLRRLAAGLALGLLVSASAVPAPALAQCAMCKEALTSDPVRRDGGDLRKGYFWSILFMLGVPFTIAGLLVWKIALEARRAGEAAGTP